MVGIRIGVATGLFSFALVLWGSWETVRAQEQCQRRGFFRNLREGRIVGYRGPYAGGCENTHNGPPTRWYDPTGRWVGDGPVNPISTYKQPCLADLNHYQSAQQTPPQNSVRR